MGDETMVHDLEQLLRRRRMTAILIFDTATPRRGPRTGGHEPHSRHLLYEVDRLCLDLRLDRESLSAQSLLVGQLADRFDPLKPLADIPVILTSGRRVLARTESDRRGEFRMLCPPRREAMALCLPLGEDHLIEVTVT